MSDNKTNWWVIVAVAVVVAVISSLITISLTGNVIKQNNNVYGKYQLYTKPEIDAKLIGLTSKGAVLDMLNKCEFISTDFVRGSGSTCDKICLGKNKKAILAEVGINELRFDIDNMALVPNNFTPDIYPGEVLVSTLNCVCCSP